MSYTPTGVVFTSYTYRPDGLRHSIGNTVHLWDGENIVADIVGNSITAYIRGLTLLYANDGNEFYYHFNAHGDVVVLTDEDGTKEKSYSYNAFGVEEDPSALDDNPFRYCGEYFDKVNEKIYLRARYYDANQGRFTQQDGWVYVCQDIPSSLNLYTYCWNNPIRFRDYSGNFPFETIFDVASLCFSVVEFVVSPNLVTLGNVAWDLGSIFMPYVPGSYVKKGTKLLAIASNKVNDIIQIMNRAKNTAEKIDVFLENRRYIVGSYKNIKKVLKSLEANLLELGYEVHHLIEKRFEKILGIKNTDDILSIVLDNETHDKITAALRGIIGYANDHKDRTTLTANAQDVWKAIVEVYEKFGLKDYLPMLKEYLLQNAENVGKIFDWRGY